MNRLTRILLHAIAGVVSILFALYASAVCAPVGVEGTIYHDDQAVSGTVYLDATTMMTMTTNEATPTECTPFEDESCRWACENELTNPYCVVFQSTCTPTGGGTVKCNCWYFCPTLAGGVHPKPKDAFSYPSLAITDPQEEPR